MTKSQKKLRQDNNAKALQCNYQGNLKRYRKGQFTCSMKNKNWSLYSSINVPSKKTNHMHEVDFEKLVKVYKRF